MKTSLDIPDEMLSDLLKFTKKSTKKDAIITAISEFNQRYRMQRLVRHAGKLKNLMTQDELRKMRQ